MLNGLAETASPSSGGKSFAHSCSCHFDLRQWALVIFRPACVWLPNQAHAEADIPIMKTIPVEDAVAMIPDGASLMIGGFMGVGTPERIIDELVRQGKKISRSSQTTQRFQDAASENLSVRD